MNLKFSINENNNFAHNLQSFTTLSFCVKLIQDEKEPSGISENSSQQEKPKSNLEADNKQLRELLTSLHEKQQTTSLEVLTETVVQVLMLKCKTKSAL